MRGWMNLLLLSGAYIFSPSLILSETFCMVDGGLAMDSTHGHSSLEIGVFMANKPTE